MGFEQKFISNWYLGGNQGAFHATGNGLNLFEKWHAAITYPLGWLQRIFCLIGWDTTPWQSVFRPMADLSSIGCIGGFLYSAVLFLPRSQKI